MRHGCSCQDYGCQVRQPTRPNADCHAPSGHSKKVLLMNIRRIVSRSTANALFACTALGSMLINGMGTAFAQDYPSKPVRMIVPFAAGGSIDIGTRMLAQRLTPRLGQSVIVENKPGAEGVIGTDYVIKSPPDGYTILAVGGSSFTSALVKNLPFDLIRDLQPITLTRVGPSALMVNAAFPPKNLAELKAWVKANPGKLNFGGSTAPTSLATEMFKKAAGIDGAIIPYKGSGPIQTALLSGEVQIALDPPASYKALIDSGRLRILAVTDKERLAMFPNAATTYEQGVNMSFATNTGFWFPAKTAKPIVDRMNKEIVAVVLEPDMKKWVESTGSVPFGSTPEYFRDFIARDHAFLAEAAKMVNYQPQ